MGNIKHKVLSDTQSEYTNSPLEFLKSQWENLELNSIYLVRILCGSAYIAIVQKYHTQMYGSIAIYGYGLPNPLYSRNVGGTWVDDKIVANSDLESAIGIIRLSEGNIKTFRQALTGRINRITILAFSQVSDNPFSFDSGFAIAFHSGLLDNNTQFQLIGINYDGTIIEPKKLDIS